MEGGAYNPSLTAWQNYKNTPQQVKSGENKVALRMLRRGEGTTDQLPLEVADIELPVDHHYPTGP